MTGAARAAAAVLAALLALLPLLPASAGLRQEVPHRLTGTLYGADGRAVSALIGFDLRDGLGRRLGATGCVESAACRVDGHALTRRVNADLGPEGSTDLRRWATTWSVTLPGNAERVYVEVYPQGVGHAGTDERRYGRSFRRNLPLPHADRVNLRLPVVCAAGGDTGFVNGYAVQDGEPVPLRRVTAFSLEAGDNGPTPVLGWQIGVTWPNGYFLLPNLASGVDRGQAPGQRYQLIATAEDGRVQRVLGVRVHACRGVRVDIAF